MQSIFLYLNKENKMSKWLISLCGAMILFCSHMVFAATECDSTWNNSSAAQSCGTVCTNPVNSFHYPFSSTYNAEHNECTFNAGCCQGMPYQICNYNYAVCSPTQITVKKEDSQFYNDHGTLKHE